MAADFTINADYYTAASIDTAVDTSYINATTVASYEVLTTHSFSSSLYAAGNIDALFPTNYVNATTYAAYEVFTTQAVNGESIDTAVIYGEIEEAGAVRPSSGQLFPR